MNAMRNLATVCLVLVCLLALSAAAHADDAQSPSPEASPAVWSAEAKITKLFDSYTSYEFGNPVEPYQAPLSRLEFALNTWWGGVEIKRWTPRWSIGLEALTNIQNGVDGKMADSDWEDGYHPKVRTVYSESNLRLRPSYMVNASADVSVKPWLPLPEGLDLRPTGGIRWQFFDLMAFDGTQWATYPDGSVDTMPLSGDSIHFKQTYWHYFVGLRLDWQPMPQDKPGLRLRAQVDWAYVTGSNTDHHLLRAGTRITEERTGGEAWHASLGLEAPVFDNFFVGIQAEYMTIDTSGSHRLYNDLFDIDLTWTNGVNVWSQQCSLNIACKYCF